MENVLNLVLQIRQIETNSCSTLVMEITDFRCELFQASADNQLDSWKMNIFNSLCVLRGLLLCCRDFKGDQLLAATGNDALGNIHCMLTMDENAHQLYD